METHDEGSGPVGGIPADAWHLLPSRVRVAAAGGGRPEAVERALVEQGHSRGPRGLTPGELYERARELGVEGRARMAPGELKRAILATLARAPERRAPAEPSRAALYARAQALGIARRSRMSKAELAEAVAAAEATGTG